MKFQPLSLHLLNTLLTFTWNALLNLTMKDLKKLTLRLIHGLVMKRVAFSGLRMILPADKTYLCPIKRTKRREYIMSWLTVSTFSAILSGIRINNSTSTMPNWQLKSALKIAQWPSFLSWVRSLLTIKMWLIVFTINVVFSSLTKRVWSNWSLAAIASTALKDSPKKIQALWLQCSDGELMIKLKLLLETIQPSSKRMESLRGMEASSMRWTCKWWTKLRLNPSKRFCS